MPHRQEASDCPTTGTHPTMPKSSFNLQNEVRLQRAAQRAAAEEARRARERSKRAAEARRPAANVIMSDAQRRAVEGALASVRAENGATASVRENGASGATDLASDGDVGDAGGEPRAGEHRMQSRKTIDMLFRSEDASTMRRSALRLLSSFSVLIGINGTDEAELLKRSMSCQSGTLHVQAARSLLAGT